MIIDTHAHLYFPDYADTTVTEILERAQAAGVGTVINIGTDLSTSQQVIAQAQEHERLFAAVGAHPQDAHRLTESDIASLFTLAQSSPKVVAIGEIGLEYCRMGNTVEDQHRVFRAMLAIAKEVELPYIIHNREATEDVLRLIKDSGYFNGVVHCFGGDLTLAETLLDMGLSISLNGILTFKNAIDTQKAATLLPLSKILLETDCPFLAPVPHRGKRNEPSYTSLVAAKLAELRGVAVETIAETTTQNTLRLFTKLPQK